MKKTIYVFLITLTAIITRYYFWDSNESNHKIQIIRTWVKYGKVK